MTTLNPYLTFNGNCREAFDFYKSVFRTEFTFIGLYKDIPNEQPIPESEQNKIMHISLPINAHTSLMGSDASEFFGQKIVPGDNISISVNCDDENEARRIYPALSSGGKIIMPLEKQFWGALYGLFVDKFGIPWMVSYDYNQNKQERA